MIESPDGYCIVQQIVQNARPRFRWSHSFRFGFPREVYELNLYLVIGLKQLCEALEDEAPVDVDGVLFELEFEFFQLFSLA